MFPRIEGLRVKDHSKIAFNDRNDYPQAFVYSSIRVSIFMGRPSSVRSITKSQLHTWLRRSGRRRMHEPSASHNRPRLGCLCGTLRPSCFQIRSTLERLTDQPSCPSRPAISR